MAFNCVAQLAEKQIIESLKHFSSLYFYKNWQINELISDIGSKS